MFVELCAILLVVFWMWNRQKTARAREMIAKFPGPRALPIIGNVTYLGGTTADNLKRATKTYDEYSKGGAPFRLLLGPKAVVVLTHPKDLEIILSSQKHIEKGFVYNFVVPWLGTGLLTSTGSKWRRHRKILTPAFHFKILGDFLDIFNANAKVLVDILRTHVNGPGFDVYKYITLYTLDNICETAMGVKIYAQCDKESEYVQALRNQSLVVVQRAIVKPWLAVDFLFNLTKWKNIQDNALEILHSTTNRVIKVRRAALEKARSQGVQSEGSRDGGTKKRLAFLDILVEAALEDSGMTDVDIREEVDTFMSAGHHTTASAISFTLWLLSWHQQVQPCVANFRGNPFIAIHQERAYRELQQVFPESSAPLTMRGLQELKYMERVIKEALRLYPSAPSIARRANEDVTLSGGLVIPEGSTIYIAVGASHKNPAFWPDPLRFDPERFTPERVQGRHPFAYLPFSGGPRNCIGQKLAVLQIKSTVCDVLRAFKLLPGSQEPDIQLANELVLISANGIPVKLENRHSLTKESFFEL